MERTVNQVIEKISQILVNFCNEEENINNWKKEFEWFVEIDKNKHTKYWNLAPEYIELLKWQQLSNIMNMFILFDGPHNEWETMIINVFLNKDKQSNISYPFIDEYSSEWFSDNTTMEEYNNYKEDDKYQEEQQTSKAACSVSKC